MPEYTPRVRHFSLYIEHSLDDVEIYDIDVDMTGNANNEPDHRSEASVASTRYYPNNDHDQNNSGLFEATSSSSSSHAASGSVTSGSQNFAGSAPLHTPAYPVVAPFDAIKEGYHDHGYLILHVGEEIVPCPPPPGECVGGGWDYGWKIQKIYGWFPQNYVNSKNSFRPNQGAFYQYAYVCCLYKVI